MSAATAEDRLALALFVELLTAAAPDDEPESEPVPASHALGTVVRKPA